MYKQHLNSQEKKYKKVAIWLTILLAVALIIIFILSFGKVKGSKKSNIPKEFKEPKKDVNKEHEILLKKIKAQENEKYRLDKIVWRIFLLFRIICILAWLGILYTCYLFGLVTNLGSALNVTQVIVLFLLVIYFLIFGSITSLKESIDSIKKRTEIFVYRKNVYLKGELKNNRQKLLIANKKIEKVY